MGSGKCNLPKRVVEDLAILADKYDISQIVLFGSRVRGDNTAKSDVSDELKTKSCEMGSNL